MLHGLCTDQPARPRRCWPSTLVLGARRRGADSRSSCRPRPAAAGTSSAAASQQTLQARQARRQGAGQQRGGAGGTIGLAQLINNNKGDGNALMVSGKGMVSAIYINKSPVSLTNATPIARLTGEYEVLVVPASSPLKTMADLVAMYKANPGACRGPAGWPAASTSSPRG